MRNPVPFFEIDRIERTNSHAETLIANRYVPTRAGTAEYSGTRGIERKIGQTNVIAHGQRLGLRFGRAPAAFQQANAHFLSDEFTREHDSSGAAANDTK